MAQVSKACKARDVRRLNDLLSRVFRRPNWDDPVSGPRSCCYGVATGLAIDVASEVAAKVAIEVGKAW